MVKVPSIYTVVHDDGKDTSEVMCVYGEHFPPTRSGKGVHFELRYAATHAHKHGELQSKKLEVRLRSPQQPCVEPAVGRRLSRRVIARAIRTA